MKKIHLMAAATALLLSGGVFMKANSINNSLLEDNLTALTDAIEVVIWQGEGGDEKHNQTLNKDVTSVGKFDAGASWDGGGSIGTITFASKSKCKIVRWYCVGSSKEYEFCRGNQELTMFVCS